MAIAMNNLGRVDFNSAFPYYTFRTKDYQNQLLTSGDSVREPDKPLTQQEKATLIKDLHNLGYLPLYEQIKSTQSPEKAELFDSHTAHLIKGVNGISGNVHNLPPYQGIYVSDSVLAQKIVNVFRQIPVLQYKYSEIGLLEPDPRDGVAEHTGLPDARSK